jgi:hypothetical protein
MSCFCVPGFIYDNHKKSSFLNQMQNDKKQQKRSPPTNVDELPDWDALCLIRRAFRPTHAVHPYSLPSKNSRRPKIEPSRRQSNRMKL